MILGLKFFFNKPSLAHVDFVLQNKHPHVIYEYADSSIQGCAVTEGFGGSGSPGGGGPLGGGGGGYGKRQVSDRHQSRLFQSLFSSLLSYCLLKQKSSKAGHSDKLTDRPQSGVFVGWDG